MSARSIVSFATGSTRPLRARHCSASTRDQAEIRSSRSSLPACSIRVPTRLGRLPVPQALDELVRARLSGLPASTRKALALASALGRRRSCPGAGGRGRRDSGAGNRRAGDRARGRLDSLHASASRVGSLRGPGRGQGARPPTDRAHRRGSAPARPSSRPVEARAGCRDRRRARRAPRGWRPSAVRRPSPPSSPSRRSGSPRRSAATDMRERWLRLGRITPPESGRAPGRSRPRSWPRPRTARCAPTPWSSLPSSRASAAPSHCSRRHWTRRATRPALQSEIYCRLAWATRFQEGFVRALEHARAALELAEGLDDDMLRARAQVVQAILGWIVGDADAQELPARADDFANALGGERLVQEATFAVVNTFASSSRERRGSHLARARVPRLVRARRAAERPRPVGPLVDRVLGWAVDARGRARRSGA